MSVDLETLSSMCPQVPAEVVERHLRRLPESYRKRFDAERMAIHLQAIHELSRDRPARAILEPDAPAPGRIRCTVAAFDHPFEFSLITGVLAGAGFHIDTGDVYTLPPPPEGEADTAPERPSRRRSLSGRHAPGGRHGFSRTAATRTSRDPHAQPVIIDCFEGRLASPSDGVAFEDEQDVGKSADTAAGPDAKWLERTASRIEQVLAWLDEGSDASVQKAKQRVNEVVTERLARHLDQPASMLGVMQSIDLELEKRGPGRSRLTVTAQDTPAFLYALSNALSLRGLSIDAVRISSDPGQDRVVDEIDVSYPRTVHVSSDSLRLSALLTKQFTYFLEQSADPFTALTRFERLTEDIGTDPSDADRWLTLLREPNTMRDLAKLLGASDFLWEDFIRGKYGRLLPLLERRRRGEPFAEPDFTIPQRVEATIDGAVGLAEQQDRLNKFKDQETFLLDLDHILNPAVGDRELGESLTLLAEQIVATSTALVYQDLVRSFGHPPLHKADPPKGNPLHRLPNHQLPYAVFGLGKLGGVALGYASDIELMYVYAGDPNARTTGGKRDPISAVEFFDTLTQEASQFIRTKRAGIFEVDMRLRPYGEKGPPATNIELFEKYYGPGGEAHPFERLALVRLRWLAGNPVIGYEVEKLRDRYVYDGAETVLDLPELWELWDRMKGERLSSRSTYNAKYSPGAMTDLEGTVQLLQVAHAGQAPQLRQPRLTIALDTLQLAGVVDADAYADLRGAYDFYRRLINALRMLRGSADDLFLPERESQDFTHLARRMGYRPGRTGVLLDDFQAHADAVRRFIKSRFDRDAPGAGE